jgi:predicted nucleic acid-binding protein
MTSETPTKAVIYLDSNVFIDAYEGEPELSTPARSLLEALETRPGLAVTSELALVEVLVRPEREGNSRSKNAYLDLLLASGLVHLIPLTRDLLLDTAKLRATHPTRLHLADSIHLATAIRSACRVLVSRDTRLTRPAGMRRMAPDVHGADAIMDTVQ